MDSGRRRIICNVGELDPVELGVHMANAAERKSYGKGRAFPSLGLLGSDRATLHTRSITDMPCTPSSGWHCLPAFLLDVDAILASQVCGHLEQRLGSSGGHH